jgi:TetR/AcrR family transcriptional repressor of lmrAB and yxaGH operons
VLTTQISLYKFQRMEPPASKTRVIRATLDLLSKSGLAGAGIKQVAAASAVPEGSVSQLFPGGKLELATVALEEAERGIGQWFREVFHQRKSIGRKVELLFTDAAKNVEASEFMKGCPVAAVTLDVDRDSEGLRAVCRTIFLNWQDIIAAGLDEVPKGKRREVAELILATLEGALILSRAEATKDPLLRGGRILGDTLARRFQAVPPRRKAKSHRTRARNTRRP